jgi:hypothetical protein
MFEGMVAAKAMIFYFSYVVLVVQAPMQFMKYIQCQDRENA